MPYVPTFITPYLEHCLEQGIDPRSGLNAWIHQQSQSSTINEPLAMTTTHNIASSQQPPFLSTAHYSSTSNQSSGFLSPDPTPQILSPSRFEAFKDNIELSFPKRLGPFITQTSTIFQEIIGGRATGEDEPEERQGDRKVQGFVYTRQGKRRTLFAAAVSPTLGSPHTHVLRSRLCLHCYRYRCHSARLRQFERLTPRE
jgi:hypothetical protein